MRDLRQVHLVHDRAGALELSGGRLDRGLHFRSRDVGEMSAQQSHSQALHVAGERCAVVGHRQNARGRVGRIVAGDGAEHQRAVPSGARHRAHVIHRPREWEYAGSAHAAVGRLEPGDAAERGRDPDRPAGVGAERARRQTGRDGRAGARGRPAGDAVSVCAPGVTRVAVVRVDALGPVRELVHVELAEHDRPRAREPGHDRRVRGRHRVGQDPRATGRAYALRRIEVLRGPRNSVQRADGPSGHQLGLGRARRHERRVGAHRDERAKRAVEGGDAIEVGAHDLDRRNLLGHDHAAEIGHRSPAELAHQITRY